MEEVKISAVIITYNEERCIERCLQSLNELVDEIVVVDSFSTDSTPEICKAYGVTFIQHPFEGYVTQKNFAVDQARYDKVLSLDADEFLSSALQESIRMVKESWHGNAYSFNRLNNYCGKWLRFSGVYPDRKIRLWDRRIGKWGGTDPHDLVILNKGKSIKLKGDLIHYSYTTVDEHLKKAIHFSTVAAMAKHKRGERSWFLINIVISPAFRFFKSYVIQLGFLDGYYGFIYCAISSCLTLFKYIQLKEYNRGKFPK